MRKFIIYLGFIILAVVGLLIACEDDKVVHTEEIENLDPVSIRVIENSAILASRIQMVNEPLQIEVLNSATYMKVGDPAKADDVGDATEVDGRLWTYLAEAGSYMGRYSASHIVFNKDSLVYVTYNIRGETYGGALEVINVADPDDIFTAGFALFPDTDINQVAVDPSSNRVWLAGSSASGAVLFEGAVSDAGVVSGYTSPPLLLAELFDNPASVAIEASASTNSIFYVTDVPNDPGQFLYVTCGNTYGGLVKVNASDLTVIDHESFPHAKYAVLDRGTPNYEIIVLTGGTPAVPGPATNGFIKNYDPITLDLLDGPSNYIYDLGVVLHTNLDDPEDYQQYGKNTLVLAENRTVYAALGSSGVAAYKVNLPEAQNPQHVSVSDMLDDGNSNGVSYDEEFDYLYMANGADGLAVAEMPTADNPIDPLFKWDTVDEPASANFVASGHFYPERDPKPEYSLIFVAKGLGGVKIIKVTDIPK